MFNCNITAICDVCGAEKAWESQEFKIGTPIKVQVPKTWHLVAVDGEGKHANVLMCDLHKELDVLDVMRKAPVAGPEPTVVHPKR